MHSAAPTSPFAATIAMALGVSVAGNACAAELGGWAELSVSGLLPADNVVALAHPRQAELGFLGQTLRLEATPLAEVAALGGGSVTRLGGLAWTCFIVPDSPIDMRISFLADHPVDHIAEPLGTIAIELASPNRDQAAQCTPLPAGTALPTLDAPSTGSFLSDLTVTLGDARPDRSGALFYGHEEMIGAEHDWLRLQLLSYRVVDDLVVATAFGQVSLHEVTTALGKPDFAGNE